MKYIIFDRETAGIVVELPQEAAHLKPGLQKELQAAFFGEPENAQTAERMDNFVEQWLNENMPAAPPARDGWGERQK